MRLFYWTWLVTPPVFGVALSLITQRIIPHIGRKIKRLSGGIWILAAKMHQRNNECRTEKFRMLKGGGRLPSTSSGQGGVRFILMGGPSTGSPRQARDRRDG